MNELIQLALHPFNIVYTMLLIIAVLYWLTVIIGVLDINALDINFDLDVDSDIDIDGEMNAGGGIGGILQFFNFDFLASWGKHVQNLLEAKGNEGVAACILNFKRSLTHLFFGDTFFTSWITSLKEFSK